VLENSEFIVFITVPVLTSLLLALLLTPAMRNFAVRMRWLDQPDQGRKAHAVPCPRVGGVPIMAAFAGAFVVLMLVDPSRASSILALPHVWAVFCGVVLMFATGLLDDLFSLRPWQKLAGEIGAATLMFYGGVAIHTLGPITVPAILCGPLTVIWLVGCTNAFNLIDGADGLAGGLGFFSALAVLGAGLIQSNVILILVSSVLAAALVGFLRYNIHPASIFLGDCGSLLIGFILASAGVVWSQQATALLAVAAPVIAFAVPLFDTAISILRRFLRRQPIFSADRDHIHHRLLDRGFTTPRLVLALHCVAAALAMLALAETTAGPVGRAAAIAVFAAGVYLAIQYLRYREFGLAASALRQNDIRAVVRSHLALARCEEALAKAQTAEQCWESILCASRELGFSDVVFSMRGRTYRENGAHRAGANWTLLVPLSGSDYLRFMCPFAALKTPAIIAPVADTLHRVLTAKAAELMPPTEEFRIRSAEFARKRRQRTRAIAAMAPISDRLASESFITGIPDE